MGSKMHEAKLELAGDFSKEKAMDKRSTVSWMPLGAALALVLVATGCATKKYVRNNIGPLEARLGKVEEHGTENSRRISEVDQNAQQGIGEAKSRAGSAAQEASLAGRRAEGAEALAQKGLTEADRIREELRNAANFQLLQSETVRFGFDRSDLDEAAIRTLDHMVSAARSAKRYVIEVQGFTDQLGSEQYNLELSRRRADAVVRYLTMVHEVPLARVFRVGYGEDQPVAPNESREGREQNRRVEIRVLAVQQLSDQTVQTQASKPGQE
jgi:outer membrane protein OmpA-like peptidoglycan-associated protein